MKMRPVPSNSPNVSAKMNDVSIVIYRLLATFLSVISLQPLVSSATENSLLKIEKISDHIYAIVGPFGNRTPDNLGNNASFGFVVTEQGVVLVDPGGSYKGAAQIHSLIRRITDKPITVVINTGGQDHRWLGNQYFKERGARIIASARSVEDQREREQDQYFVLGNLIGEDGLSGTKSVFADEVFTGEKTFNEGGVYFELKEVGPAHTPGDSIVWLPKEKVLFSGDVVYVGRMLGVIAHSNSSKWISAFDAIESLLPDLIVPGHGPVSTLEQARADTYDYLVYLRKTVSEFMEKGGDITEIGSLDQSKFEYLVNYDALKGRNAQQVFQELEWE